MTSVLETGQQQAAAADRAERGAGSGGLPGRFHFETTDLDEACGFMARVYGLARISTPDKIALVRLSGLTAGPLRLSQSDLRMTLDHHAAPVRQVLIGYVVAGVLRRQAADQAAVFGPGDAALLKQPGQDYSGRSESALMRTVSFEASLLDQVADGLPNRDPAPVRFTSMTAVSAAAAQRLRAILEFAWGLVAGNPAAGDQPLVTGSTARLLAAAALHTFPNTAATEPGRPPRRQPRHAGPGDPVHRGACRVRPELGGNCGGRERQHPRCPAGLPPGARPHAAGLPAPGPAGAGAPGPACGRAGRADRHRRLGPLGVLQLEPVRCVLPRGIRRPAEPHPTAGRLAPAGLPHGVAGAPGPAQACPSRPGAGSSGRTPSRRRPAA